jgi:hypothetical protein
MPRLSGWRAKSGPADTGAMMVKATGPHSWPEGDVDLLGHLF